MPTNEWRRDESRTRIFREIFAIGEVVEAHLDNRPHPKVLVMAIIDGEPAYASCAFDGSIVYVVTVHRYDAEW